MWVFTCTVSVPELFKALALLTVRNLISGGCATIPESDLEERTVIPGSAATFPSGGPMARQKSKHDREDLVAILRVKSLMLVNNEYLHKADGKADEK
ncbi:protein pthb1-like [Limosa lapponica baueri]|uniref:Protein pthb1-like n=1 Tax=Limosa lapponica baueri TaxID=1758121 RepID=A0A2I0UDG7_LIMLA|nr:protein pthb1-like [Limosa lapponica baueri]